MNTLSDAARNHLLALADDEHILGARHARWIGLGPFLEEDLAFCSIAQDELGHAISLYEVILGGAGESDDASQPVDDRIIDHFALLRAPEDYRSCHLVEAPCTAWNDALVRHWLYDLAEELRWTALASSTVASIPQRAAQAEREEAFHRNHADLLMAKALSTTAQARAQIETSLRALLPLAAGMFDPLIDEAQALDEGVVAEPAEQIGRAWWAAVTDRLTQWGVDVDQVVDGGHDSFADLVATGSSDQRNRQARSEAFGPLLESLQEVITLDTNARW